MKYSIVGYGSLLSHDSLKETIKDKRLIPVIVKGYKRVFNLIDSKNGDALDVEESKGSEINGVLFEVNESELAKLQEREDGYVPRKTLAYDFKSKEKIGDCFLFIDYVDVDYENHKPDKNYFLLCREAAYNFGEEFGMFWDETTFLSSGERVSEWIRSNKSWNKIPQKNL